MSSSEKTDQQLSEEFIAEVGPEIERHLEAIASHFHDRCLGTFIIRDPKEPDAYTVISKDEELSDYLEPFLKGVTIQ